MAKLFFWLPIILIITGFVMKLQGKPISWWLIASPMIGLVMACCLALAALGIPGVPEVSARYMLALKSLFVVGFAGLALMIVSTIMLLRKIVSLL